MDQLRSRVTTALVSAFLMLLGIDVLDDLLLGNRWAGAPREFYPLVGAIIAGLFASQAFRRNGQAEKQGDDKEK